MPRTVDNERDLVELDELRILRGLRVSYEQAVLYLGRHRLPLECWCSTDKSPIGCR